MATVIKYDKVDKNKNGIIEANEISGIVEKEEKSKRWVVILAISVILLCIILGIAIWLIISLQKKVDKYTKGDALRDIGLVVDDVVTNLTIENITLLSVNSTKYNVYNLSDDTLSTICDAYCAFDDNNDELWNIDEYQDYLLYIGQSEPIFDSMDIDDDQVLSFPEVIVFLKALSTVNSARNVFIYYMAPIISTIYDIDIYDINTSSISDIWYEYAAAIIFNEYDPGYKGFVTLEDYVTNQAISGFISIDSNNDSYIDLNEYINATFETDKLELSLLGGLWGEYNESSYQSISSLLTLSNVINQPIDDCLVEYYDGLQEERRRLVSTGAACAGGVAGCSAGAIGAAACCYFIVTCTPCVAAAIAACAAGTGACTTVAVDNSGCISDKSIFIIKKDDGNIERIMAKYLNVGDIILTMDGFEPIIHTAHFIFEDGNNSISFHRKLCYFEDCITMSYNHMLFVNDIDTLKPASDVQVGDVIFIYNSTFQVEKRKVLWVEENVQTYFRNIFTESGTIVVNDVLASSFTGKNNWDASLQSNVLNIFAKIIKFYDSSLVHDDYKMMKLRTFIYYDLVKPIINFSKNIYVDWIIISVITGYVTIAKCT